MTKARNERNENNKDPAHEKDFEGKRKIKLMNPLSCLRIIFWKDTALVLWMSASFYAVWYCVQTSIPNSYKSIYGFNELDVGLCYLPGGFGVICGGYFNGKMMDRNYKVVAKQIGHVVDRVAGDNLDEFPIERARSRGSWYFLVVYIAALLGYGWALDAHIHASLPLIVQFVLGFLCTCFNLTFNALIVDIFPANPSTAAASANIIRCALSAMAVAVMQPFVDAIGNGWYFTFLGILSGIGGGFVLGGIKNKGMKWRGERLARTGRRENRQELTIGKSKVSKEIFKQ